MGPVYDHLPALQEVGEVKAQAKPRLVSAGTQPISLMGN